MKQSLISLVIGATMAFGAVAQDVSGGEASGSSAVGGLTAGAVATGVVGIGVLAAVVSNNRGSSVVDDSDEASCDGDDGLVDGVCVGTTTTVTDTVTVSGTNTITVTTPITVTYTYLPTVQ
ncbi:hypothetical protein [Alteromonas sp. C1M14]|uniref:hypothetical protein n=1 Tax=Alteromonas sp. C1M14 TaxID=2841567 RepID=UPI001C084629|nr:hypothetical protein [Alteromonas sp. C1M14]MBU2979834.1 hypothetical protein [Alteromonas sp. C1M14]